MTAALGWLGSALVVVSLTQRDVRRLRQMNLVASVVLGAFNVIVGIASMIALNAVLAMVNGYHLLRARRPRASRTEERVDVAEELGPRRLVRTQQMVGAVQ